MIPPLIVRAALEAGISIIAVTDHNATANIAAVQQAALGTSLLVLPGMEVQTREEVHSLCLFSKVEMAYAFQAIVDASLPDIENQPEFFGEQFVVDKTGEFIRREERLLITSTSLSLEEARRHVHALNGIFIPAHVNRKAFGLLENLGFVPSDLAPDALEVSRHLPVSQAAHNFPSLAGYPLVKGGDAHRLDELLGLNRFELDHPSLSELRLALQNEAGRSLYVLE